MKRFLAILIGISMVFCFLSAFTYGEKSIARTDKHASGLTDAETVLFLAADDGGKSMRGIGYKDDDFANAAPESFAVDNGIVYVLDTVNSRIVIDYAGKNDEIELSGMIRPTHMCVIAERAYVTDHSADSIYEVNLVDHTIKAYDLPAGITSSSVYRLYKGANDSLILLDHDLQSFVFSRDNHDWETSVKISCKAVSGSEYEITGVTEEPVRIEVGYNTMVQYVSGSDERIVIIAYEYVPNVSVIMFEKTVRVFNSNGELVGVTVAEDDVYACPDDEVYISEDGSIYMMHCLNEGVFITKPNLRVSYDSNMLAIAKEAHALCNLKDSDTGTRGAPITSYTRSQVITRARSCATYAWTFNPDKNGLRRYYTDNNGITHRIELPKDEQGVTTNKAMIGIPYCRGMHDGPSGFTSKLNQKYTGDSYNAYYTAGNTQTPACYGSTGLDCSGLACYAYSAPSTSYWTTGSFALNGNGYDIGTVPTTGSTNSGIFANMKSMDFIVKADKHIVLFVNTNGASSVRVIHSSGYHDKVVEEDYSISNLYGFKMKSPYSCTVNGCQHTYADNGNGINHTCTCSICGDSVVGNHTYSNSYNHTDLFHFYECNKCGARKDVAVHTFIRVGMKYRCTGCGYETTRPITPYSIGTKPYSLNTVIVPEFCLK